MNFFVAAIDRLLVHGKTLMRQTLHRGAQAKVSALNGHQPVVACPPAHRRGVQAMPQVGSAQCNRKPQARKPLRVIRVVDQGTPRTSVGRMVMSGSMAEICAELDRLAACEAGALTH